MTAALAIRSAATKRGQFMPPLPLDLYDERTVPDCLAEPRLDPPAQFTSLRCADSGTQSKGFNPALLWCVSVVTTASGLSAPFADNLGDPGTSSKPPYELTSTREATTAPASTLYSGFAVRIAELLEGYEQYNRQNWDGYDAEPITPETLRYARSLLRVMPDTFGLADIAPSGDGSIGLEWVLDAGPLHKLFLDIGPGEEWRAYWKLRDGSFGRLPGAGFDSRTSQVLKSLFSDLSSSPNVAVRR